MDRDTDRVSESLPAYDIGGELGRGGWGVVLSGRHRALGRPVAIKQLPPAFASDPAVRHRFTAEGRLLASLDHPHVVPVYDYVEHDGLCLLVMELLPGGTVWNRFAGTGLNSHSAVAVVLACAAGLKAAHERGILHRDVKPENLMFAASGAVKVTDFGIAKVVGGDETLATREGDVIGTPSYIAPEQARGGELSPATDVYAMATMLYELLSGSLPFPPADEPMAILFMHAFDQPTPLSETAPTVPEQIAEVVMRGLATDPQQRYATAEEFGVALAAASAGRWGPGWLAAEGIPVMGADTIVTAAGMGTAPPPPVDGEHPTLPVTRPLARPVTGTSTVAEAGGPTVAGVGEATVAGGGESTAPGSVPPGSAPLPGTPLPPPTPPTMRPTTSVHARGVRLIDVADADLVPVRSVVDIPSPRVPYRIAAALAAVTIAVALLGLGSAVGGETPPPGTVTVAGVDPGTVDPVRVDLVQPVPVSAAGPVPADSVSMTLKALGQPVKQVRTAPLAPVDGGVAATLPSLGGQYLVAGELTGELSFLQAGRVTQTWQFPVRTEQSALTTAAAVGVAALFLFGIAYVESFVRALRRGRRRISASIGLPLSVGVLAVAVVGAVWVLLGRQPTVATVVVCAVLGVLAGVAAAIGAARVGRRRRYRRARWEDDRGPDQRRARRAAVR
ncbi:serine/threonine-protein kinase [Rhodococcus maanshanensis]|uniref:non-specific serine/threonine protein kinase n=1 Tax=Rhodococcus maanshanensis TaxID=183556 RepID=A0A1H7RG72_9NOCA|nr:serine/threonine-protein kinase [Rhodococcus maanshanensis]SEL59183.1 serine/threonine protein kinase [Rhodococcus maanshanensis]